LASKANTIRRRIIDLIKQQVRDADGAGAGSVNDFARVPQDVHDRPSCDVILGRAGRFQRPSDYADRERIIKVRVYERLHHDADLEELVEAIEAIIRADPTLGIGLVDVRVGDDAGVDVITDEGFAAHAGLGPQAEILFKARGTRPRRTDGPAAQADGRALPREVHHEHRRAGDRGPHGRRARGAREVRAVLPRLRRHAGHGLGDLRARTAAGGPPHRKRGYHASRRRSIPRRRTDP
jgi:hypothetical protein